MIGERVITVCLCSQALALAGCDRTDLLFFDEGVVQRLGAPFATPNAIVWSWDAAALGTSVDGYLLWYGTDEREVENQTGDARPWDVDDDPNLGWGVSPFGPNLVQQTIVSDLMPETTYFARLWARFDNGDSRVVAMGSAATAVTAPPRIPIFDETLGAGWVMYGFEPTLSADAHEGSGALWATGTGAWLNTTVTELQIAVDPAADWTKAYLEFRSRSRGSRP
jgi:hypothetical protein